jgi:Holliday junction resolvase RusA-like endonuclease
MLTHQKTFEVDPIGKPRMTRRDKWNPSLAAKRYFHFKDQILAHVLEDADLRAFLKGADVHRVDFSAWLPIPKSWPKRDKAKMAGALHKQKPDLDNIEKALFDALFAEDSGIAACCARKHWDDGKGPRLEVTFYGEEKGGSE